jgi:hypothetical protein
MRTLQQQIAQMQQLFSKKPQNPKNRCANTTHPLIHTGRTTAN